MLGSSVREDMFERSKQLLEDYLIGFRNVTLYFFNSVK
jgi:hypothetical protein